MWRLDKQDRYNEDMQYIVLRQTYKSVMSALNTSTSTLNPMHNSIDITHYDEEYYDLFDI